MAGPASAAKNSSAAAGPEFSVPLARACADRFRLVGPAVTGATGDGPALISAPPEWIDRLAGVLMDNACRYAGPGGQVRIGVRAHGSRVSLTGLRTTGRR